MQKSQLHKPLTFLSSLCAKPFLALNYHERLIRAQEEIAQIQASIATLREQWQARYDAWQWHLDHISEDTAFVDGQLQSIKAMLNDLDALFPPEASA